MDEEDLSLVPWRQFKRQMDDVTSAAPGWQYLLEEVAEWLAIATEAKLRRRAQRAQAAEEGDDPGDLHDDDEEIDAT